MIPPSAQSETSAVDLLSARESQVLRMASRGLTNAQIAQRLDVSVHAIKFHLAAVYRKLGVKNRTEAAVAWVEDGDGGHKNGAGSEWT